MNYKKPITNFHQLAPLMIQKYERYLPTAFDESLSLLEKVNKIIEHMNKIGDLSNEVVDKWNEVMEWVLNDGITESVLKKLDKMVEDGSLEEIINHAIFEDLNTKIDNATNNISKINTDINDINIASVRQVENVDELRGLNTTVLGLKNNAFVKELKPNSNVGGGIFYYDPNSLDNSILSVKPLEKSSNERGRWLRYMDIVTPEMFGAYGNGIADDSEALQLFFDYIADSSFNGILKGTYLINSSVLVHGHPALYGSSTSKILVSPQNPDGVIMGDESNILDGGSFYSLRVERTTIDFSVASYGVWYRNMVSCVFTNLDVRHFRYNEFLNPLEGERVAYNTWINNHISRGQRNTMIYPEKSGYVNENVWIGGRWQTISSIGDQLEYHIRIDVSLDLTASEPNHNRFYSPSLEGGSINSGAGGLNAISVVRGYYNGFYNPRTEGYWREEHIRFYGGTQQNLVTLLRQDSSFLINGSRNWVKTPYKIFSENGEIFRIDSDGDISIKGTLVENATTLE